MTGTSVWVFGYGSLVSPTSAARTIGRRFVAGVDATTATLHGYGRRWNYGSLTQRGTWRTDGGEVHGTVVALGLEPLDGASCGGVVLRVDPDEVARLDRREADYDRVDVTAQVEVGIDVGTPTGPAFVDAPVVTYVPRPSAVERYLVARDAGRAAVRRDYWDLVHGAFDALGPGHLDAFVVTTPVPDIPVVDVTLDL